MKRSESEWIRSRKGSMIDAERSAVETHRNLAKAGWFNQDRGGSLVRAVSQRREQKELEQDGELVSTGIRDSSAKQARRLGSATEEDTRGSQARR